MTTRLGPEQQSRDWPYSSDLDGFLTDLKADVSDHTDTRMRVEMFMLTPVAKRMPRDLHDALIKAELCNPLKQRRSFS